MSRFRFGGTEMKAEGYFFIFIFAFCVVSDIIYWVLSHDPTGTVCLALTAGLGAICGFYLLFTGHRIGPRPEEIPEAEIADAAGVVGHFSPNSFWPIFIALGATFVVLGIIFGLWLTVMGFILMVITIPGLVLEYTRGPRTAHEDHL
jgi:Cytochrome c oxidase subunit IV